MPVVLTSFKKSRKIKEKFNNIELYSVSRWQPSGFYYDILEYLGAYDINGKRLLLRGRSDPLNDYKDDLFKYYVKNWDWISNWLSSLDNNDWIGLCCWCPHSKSTKFQMKTRNTFACHTGLIGKVINKHRPDIDLFMDTDRHKHLVSEWKPSKYHLIEV